MATYDPLAGNRVDPRAGAVSPSPRRESAPLAMALSGLNLVIGLWLFFAHWVLGYTAADPAWNDVIFGLAIALLATIRLTGIPATRGLGILNVAIGVWLIIAGLTISDSTAALVNNLACGGAVVILAALSALLPARELPSGQA